MTFADDRLVVFIGFMGAGKSTAARNAAEALRAEMTDVDREIERRLGKPIERVFADDGEGAFRAVEEQVTLELLGGGGSKVLALGGGAVVHPRVREALSGHLVIWLDAPVDATWARVEGSGRPLARDRSAFRRLYAEREPMYAALADVTVPSNRAQEMAPVLDALAGLPAGARMLWATSQSGDYPAYIGRRLLRHGYWPPQIVGRRFLVTDGTVGRMYADGFEPLADRIMIMPGEQSKTVAHADIVWTQLAGAGMTRADLVVALGGGVVGDLAGFCAATYQRGVRYVQVPTTLLSQVDSAYGGKTGVDLAEAKNYVGAYHEPAAVIADPDALKTLPPGELASGYAEVVKTALIAGGELWQRIRSGADPTAPEILADCVRAKLRIVASDERDAGARQILNLGHTVGHAIETATGYARYRHGEAVALGLLAALRLSGQSELRDEVRELLVGRGLPTTLDGAEPDAVVLATERDKKRLGEAPVPFVLIDRPGEVRAGCPVEPRELVAAVRELAR
jgi:shikimate kinase / 3-dehydroquinate synthase